MDRRDHVSGGLVVCWIGLSTPGICGDLADLPEVQRQTAKCMVSVLSELPEVTEPRLIVSGNPGHRVFITYTYHHQVKWVSPEISPERLDITDLLSGKEKTVLLNGLTVESRGQHSEAESERNLDDADSGMLRITHLWEERCGLELNVMTV